MARSEARLQFGMWRTGLDGLTAHAKLVYAVLLTEPTINHAGVGAVRVSRWARDASLTLAETDKALSELIEANKILLDEDTEEVFVRTLVRNDKVYEQPYVLKGALKEALQTASWTIRRSLASELRKLPPKQPDGVSKTGKKVTYPDPHATANELDPPTSPKPTQKGSETLFDAPQKGSEREGGGGRGGGISCSAGTSVLITSETADAASDPDPVRVDVEKLCAHLRDRIVSNGSKTPTITAKWRTDARLLLDRDKREPAEAHRLLDWCQDHHFWRANIESLPKFREQYDKLRLQAQAAGWHLKAVPPIENDPAVTGQRKTQLG